MSIFQLLFPAKCVLCGKVLERRQIDLCHSCRRSAPECPTPKNKLPRLDSWLALWYYEGPVRNSLLRFKFRGARSYAESYGRLLAMKIQQAHPDGFDILTWIPISRRRNFQRGYDQVELLAKYVGKELNQKPVRLLKKVRHNAAQSGISGAPQRRANVLGVYKITDPQLAAGKRILLLDDIVTTGSTAGEASRILLTAGAREVHLAAVAAAKNNTKKSDSR